MRITISDLRAMAGGWASLHGEQYGHKPGGYWIQRRNEFYELVKWTDGLAWSPVTYPMSGRELWAWLSGGIYTAAHYIVKEAD